MFSAFHCLENKTNGLYNYGKRENAVVLGAHYIDYKNLALYDTILIKEAKWPKPAIYPRYHKNWGRRRHDLTRSAKMGQNVGIICLPPPEGRYRGQMVMAAGWGMFAPSSARLGNSKVLRKVKARVSKKYWPDVFVFDWNLMLPTDLLFNENGQDMSTCAGDSGKVNCINRYKIHRLEPRQTLRILI